MINAVVGAGQGGCRIAKTFAEMFGVPAAYLNLAEVDFSQLLVPSIQRLMLEGDGTGRNPDIGEKMSRKHKVEISQFLEERVPVVAGDHVVVCIGGGGGSGAGLMLEIINNLLRRKLDILLIYTLPEKREGLPAKPNALKSLNKIIDRYLVKEKITCMVIDNDFCVERFGAAHEGDYWEEVNTGIVRSMLRFWYLTNLEKFTNFIDVTAGYGALDEKELVRVLYAKGGFVDLREFVATEPDIELAKNAKFRSLVFGNLDIGSAKQYIVTVGFPERMKNDPRVHPFLDVIFKKLQRITKTSFVLRSSHFNKKLTDIRVNVLLSGLIKSHGLKKIINQTVKDVQKYQDKGGIETIDLSEIDF